MNYILGDLEVWKLEDFEVKRKNRERNNDV